MVDGYQTTAALGILPISVKRKDVIKFNGSKKGNHVPSQDGILELRTLQALKGITANEKLVIDKGENVEAFYHDLGLALISLRICNHNCPTEMGSKFEFML